MEFKDQDKIMIHPVGMHSHSFNTTELNGVSNNDGMVAYFPSEEIALRFANSIAITSIRLERLLDTIEISENDEISYNELELIIRELNYLKELNK